MIKSVFASFASDLIKKVFNIKKKESASSSFGVGKELISERLDTVNDKVEAAMNSDVELAKREEKVNDLVMVDGHDERAGNVT